MRKLLERLLAFLQSFDKSSPSPAPKQNWMKIAKSVYGWHEVRDYKKLKDWMRASGSHDWRSVPWCGAYVATVFRKFDRTLKIPASFLTARKWLEFGYDCKPGYGAVLVFWRGSRKGWKGHVGLYVGEDKTHYHVLGGNQSNGVTVSRIAKSRLLGARCPTGYEVGDEVLVKAGKIKITTNEE